MLQKTECSRCKRDIKGAAGFLLKEGGQIVFGIAKPPCKKINAERLCRMQLNVVAAVLHRFGVVWVDTEPMNAGNKVEIHIGFQFGNVIHCVRLKDLPDIGISDGIGKGGGQACFDCRPGADRDKGCAGDLTIQKLIPSVLPEAGNLFLGQQGRSSGRICVTFPDGVEQLMLRQKNWHPVLYGRNDFRLGDSGKMFRDRKGLMVNAALRYRLIID